MALLELSLKKQVQAVWYAVFHPITKEHQASLDTLIKLLLR